LFEDGVYGAVGNAGSAYFDNRIAQSTTLTGRCIVKHMGSKINEVIAGDYNHKGASVIYGDSVTGDTQIRTETGMITIADLFSQCAEHCQVGEKEYGVWCSTKVAGFNSYEMCAVFNSVEYVMRHRTCKTLYRVTTENQHQITVTEDHSLVVDRDGLLLEIPPTAIQPNDLIITFNSDCTDSHVDYTTIQSVESLGVVDDWVYDLSIQNGDHLFFGNDCLLTNTDSIYFSAHPVMSQLEEFKDFEWSKEAVVQLYDQIADITNQSFPEFMQRSFNVPESRSVIKAGRELVASRGLFITKKRYAVLIYDKEGKRKDLDGKPGEIKAMGLDLKRADTPKPVQEFLSEILTLVLTDSPREEIFARIKTFRGEFNKWPSWSKGSPKRVNNLTQYGLVKRANDSVDLKKGPVKKKTIPGHVLASLNYNSLCEVFNDHNSMRIMDGQKVIVCKLRNNPMGYTSVAYPVDQLTLPDWFKSLPFDDEAMEEAVINKKLDNLLSVLKWNLNDTKNNETFDSMFSF
jgi:hypothetical protein